MKPTISMLLGFAVILGSPLMGGELCSTLSVPAPVWAGHMCTTWLPSVGADYTDSVRWTITPQYSTRLCSSKYNGSPRQVQDSGAGVCGIGGIDSKPSTYETIDLVGTGSNWNSYQHKWIGIIQDMTVNGVGIPGNWSSHYTFPEYFAARECEPCLEWCGPVCFECATCACAGGPVCSQNSGGWFPNCQPTCTPIVLDPFNEGFRLTSMESGVRFRAKSGGPLLQMSWTDPSSRNGWLAFDRNGDGVISDLSELFGNLSPQPPSPEPNGFLALAPFDAVANGGNGSGTIDPSDTIYDHLRVWVDGNHDGISDTAELHPLRELGLFKIDLRFHRSNYVDQHGNQFRYKGYTWDFVGRKKEACYDVIIQTEAVISGRK